jgi:hypothetical protein
MSLLFYILGAICFYGVSVFGLNKLFGYVQPGEAAVKSKSEILGLAAKLAFVPTLMFVFYDIVTGNPLLF